MMEDMDKNASAQILAVASTMHATAALLSKTIGIDDDRIIFAGLVLAALAVSHHNGVSAKRAKVLMASFPDEAIDKFIELTKHKPSADPRAAQRDVWADFIGRTTKG